LVRIGFLFGDVNGSRVVTTGDVAAVNAVIAQYVTGSNYLDDVNISGTLSLADKGLVNAAVTHFLPSP
jgi:ethanolamine utilization microcompartment shell protein EutS